MTDRAPGGYCPSCGAGQPERAAFCGDCGVPLEAPTQAVPVPARATPAASPQEAPTARPYGGAGPHETAGPYAPPLPAASAAVPRRRGIAAVVAVVALVVLAGGGFALFTLLRPQTPATPSADPSPMASSSPSAAVPGSGSTETTAAPSTDASSPTATATTSSAAGSGPPGGRHVDDPQDGIPGPFSHAGTMGGRTSAEFARNVAVAYAQSGAAGGRRVVQASSRRTGRDYSMECVPQPDGAVLCTGGDDAQVLLWK